MADNYQYGTDALWDTPFFLFLLRIRLRRTVFVGIERKKKEQQLRIDFPGGNMKKYDVIVVGAGAAGFGAAMGAARTGKKVLLVDRNSTPGGSTVFCGTPVFTPYKSFKDLPKQGIFAEFIEKAGDRCLINPSNGAYNISEFDTALLMTRLLKESGVDMLFYAALVGGTFQEGKIRKITLFCCGKNLEFSADHFVDTTGDAVLSVMAGCPVNEPPVDECMTKTVLFKVTGVKNFDKKKLAELFPQLDFPYPWQDRFMGGPAAPDGEDILLNLTAVAGNALDPFELTEMDIQLREQVFTVCDWMRRKLPGFENARPVFVAPQIGVRFSRCIVGREQISCSDLDNGTPVAEPVAWGRCSYGDHFTKTFKSPWGRSNMGMRSIPYGALLPQNISNLTVGGRCISIDPKVATAIRYAPCCMTTGQAAGIAAALGIPGYDTLKQELLKQNLI